RNANLIEIISSRTYRIPLGNTFSNLDYEQTISRKLTISRHKNNCTFQWQTTGLRSFITALHVPRDYQRSDFVAISYRIILARSSRGLTCLTPLEAFNHLCWASCVSGDHDLHISYGKKYLIEVDENDILNISKYSVLIMKVTLRNCLPHSYIVIKAQVRRFHTLIGLMLSSQTKDAVTHAAVMRLREHGLTVKIF
ncbi:hypothetical protein Avbf_07173, partial [Armadillidium vulgare]